MLLRLGPRNLTRNFSYVCVCGGFLAGGRPRVQAVSRRLASYAPRPPAYECIGLLSHTLELRSMNAHEHEFLQAAKQLYSSLHFNCVAGAILGELCDSLCAVQGWPTCMKDGGNSNDSREENASDKG